MGSPPKAPSISPALCDESGPLHRLQTTEWICFQSKHSIQTSSTRRRACPPNLVRAVPSLAKGIQSAWKIKPHRGEGDGSSGAGRARPPHTASGQLLVHHRLAGGSTHAWASADFSEGVERAGVESAKAPLCSKMWGKVGHPLCPVSAAASINGSSSCLPRPDHECFCLVARNVRYGHRRW